jgi:integrase
MVCSSATIKFQWRDFNPFFGFGGFRNRKDGNLLLPDSRDAQDEDIDKIATFNLDEVLKIRLAIPDHWKPYFDFAVSSGLRPGEQIALKASEINWDEGTITIRRAMTLDVEGKLIEGRAKNGYSRRTFKLTKAMRSALLEQKFIQERLGSRYFFCSPQGSQVDLSHFRNRVWVRTLEKADVAYRSIRQARHTFATLAISRGEDLSWIARVMGHANTQMIHQHYARFIENANGSVNGSKLDELFDCRGSLGNEG